MIRDDGPDLSDPDIVDVILRRVVALTPGFSAALAAQVSAEIRAEYGGQRLRIPKHRKYLSKDQREAVFKDGLTSMGNREIMEKHKISLSTLKRQMKRG